GIDPGLATTGISILDIEGSNYDPVYCGCIITEKNISLCIRLMEIYNGVSSIIDKYEPDCMAIEELFFSSNAKTAISVGHSRGVLMLAGGIRGLKVYEYTPLEIKQAVVGYGRATKKQIKYMLKAILGVRDDFFPNKDDAWDAMAVSICHANIYKFK
ncbi:MAG TPA: crossover junction endodeoxyribonuclease RuvC, partial [Actinobacteria bacterium]|nr:crossover junction endodeoxyribonuclease RuvC [Actinomycetota bacterium]